MPLPLERSPPVGFKRLLGGTPPRTPRPTQTVRLDPNALELGHLAREVKLGEPIAVEGLDPKRQPKSLAKRASGGRGRSTHARRQAHEAHPVADADRASRFVDSFETHLVVPPNGSRLSCERLARGRN